MKIRRIFAGIIDYWIMILLFVSFYAIPVIYELKDINLNVAMNTSMIFIVIGMIVKDIVFKNGSIGKKIMKLEIVAVDTTDLRLYRLIFRNITYILLPIEVIMIFLFNKRLGDIISKTMVVEKGTIMKNEFIY